MLLDGGWGDHEECVAFSKLYNDQIQVFGSLGSGESITRILNSEGENIMIVIFRRIL